MMVPRADFLNLGGFKEDIPIAGGEDRVLCESWYQRGWNMCYLPKAEVFHHHELDLMRFIKQQFNYGKGIHWFNSYIQKESREKRKYERLSFYLQLVWHPFKSYPIIQASKMTFLIMVAQVANLLGYIKAVLISG
jgi:GT2 family glycosyltransferase